MFFPIGAHWANEKGHYTLVLNSYYYKGTGERAGAYRFEFWPLFHVGRPRAGDLEWSILSGLVGYSRDGIVARCGSCGRLYSARTRRCAGVLVRRKLAHGIGPLVASGGL